VNILAHKAMLLLYGEGGYQVKRRHVNAAAEDTPEAEAPRAWWWPRLRASRVSSD
jgi:MSHA biogenesis protein MshM